MGIATKTEGLTKSLIEILKEGKTKQIFLLETASAQQQVQEKRVQVLFKDDATAFNGEKHKIFPGKGRLNAQITALLMGALTQVGIPTCFIETDPSVPEGNALIYQYGQMFPLEVVVRNQALGSVCKRFGFEIGSPFKQPVIEYTYKSDQSGDPVLSGSMIPALSIFPASVKDPDVLLQLIAQWSLAANEWLVAIFGAVGIDCVDFKLEFGLNTAGELLLCDELSPDNFRLRDKTNGAILDKDCFRLDQGDLIEAYETVYNRLRGLFAQPDWQKKCLSSANPMLQASTYQVRIHVARTAGLLHPESRAIESTLQQLGHQNIQTVLSNKTFDVTLNTPWMTEAITQANVLARSVFSNPVIETATVTVMPRWSHLQGSSTQESA
ncbi:MAG: phosphoribosylaminoimidazolesuccinocarboxamide synthase [Cyanobacteria bacterium]|nr:phosphoribosylaminoimidazolesuccinocarboxamide synthase [Cyanobacteriota bacterium]